MKKKIGLFSSIAIIMSSMVGTGVFTSLGYQVAEIKSISSIIILWVLGGIMALCGSLTYGELAIRFPRSGGEYNFLTKIYHPSIGFLSGWVSSTVGFSTPAALSAMAFSDYLEKIIKLQDCNKVVIGVLVIIAVTLINLFSVRLGSKFQLLLTGITVLLIVLFIFFGFLGKSTEGFQLTFEKRDLDYILSVPFATSLIYVSYAYSGWNSITYIINEVEDHKKNLPKALFWSPFIVLLLYVLLNIVFLYKTPINALEGQTEVGFIAGSYIFGESGGIFISAIICLVLLASVNSFTIAGPRVLKTIGEDFPIISKIANVNKGGSPVWAILFQSSIAVILILTSTFDKVLVYIGFTLSLFTILSVIGVFIERFKNNTQKIDYKLPFYPITPIIFIILELWMVIFTLIHRPMQSLYGLLTVLLGFVIYFILARCSKIVQVN
jgi:APA family basic amino acid/polyamine antiporter